MKLSRRVATVNGENVTDDGWSVLYRARELADRGETVTMLCIGDHDMPTPRVITDAMFASVNAGDTKYAPIEGKFALREAIAKRTEIQSGVPTTPENVFVASGGQGGLFAAMMATTDPGQRVVIIDPYYATYVPTVRSASCEPIIVRADPDQGFQLDAAALMEACDGASALLVNTPNNPTGAVYSSASLEAIREAAIAHDLWVMSDEVYETQTHSAPHISPRSLDGMAERTLVIGSFSKSHIMTGFRIGWVVGPSDMMTGLVDLTNATTYGVAGFIQDAALAALTRAEKAEKDATAVYLRRRNLALETLAGTNSLKVSPPQGAMYVMLDIRNTGLSGKEFAHALLDAHKIAVMPGESFGQAAAGHIRIALTVPDEELVPALHVISEFAQSKLEVP